MSELVIYIYKIWGHNVVMIGEEPVPGLPGPVVELKDPEFAQQLSRNYGCVVMLNSLRTDLRTKLLYECLSKEDYARLRGV